MWKSIEKHGKEKHLKEILEFLPSRSELKERERVLVNEEILNDTFCMNLRLGGAGWDAAEAAVAAIRGNTSPNRDRIAISAKILATKQERGSGNYFGGKHDTFTGRKHSDETKEKLRRPKNEGEKNSAFGTKWMTDGLKPIKVPQDQVGDFLKRGYRLGRK